MCMCVRVRVHVCMCMCACTVHVHVLYTLNVSHTMDCDTRQRHCDMGHGERGLVRFCIQHIVQGPSQAAGDRAPSRRRALSRRQHATASQKAEIDNANASLRQMHICTRSNVARCEEMNGGGRGRLKTAQAGCCPPAPRGHARTARESGWTAARRRRAISSTVSETPLPS